MRGKILRFSFQSNSGAISGDDGTRYTFTNEDWREEYPPRQDMYVDFDVRVDAEDQSNRAVDIFDVSEKQSATPSATPSATSSATSDEKSKVVAGLLAILLGGIGLHKFYLGRVGVGLIYLLVSVLTLGIGAFLTVPISIIEGIIYLTKSDQEFDEVYVQNKKAWF